MSIIKLQSSDGEIFALDVEFAKCFVTIKDMLECLGMEDDEDPILLPNVTSDIFKTLIDWVVHHKDDVKEPIEEKYLKTREIFLKPCCKYTAQNGKCQTCPMETKYYHICPWHKKDNSESSQQEEDAKSAKEKAECFWPWNKYNDFLYPDSKNVTEYDKYGASAWHAKTSGFIKPERIVTKSLNLELCQWDVNFFDQETLFDLIMAANYLNVESLIEAGYRIVANMLKYKKVEEIRQIFNIQNDFTPEEDAKISKQLSFLYKFLKPHDPYDINNDKPDYFYDVSTSSDGPDLLFDLGYADLDDREYFVQIYEGDL